MKSQVDSVHPNLLLYGIRKALPSWEVWLLSSLWLWWHKVQDFIKIKNSSENRMIQNRTFFMQEQLTNSSMKQMLQKFKYICNVQQQLLSLLLQFKTWPVNCIKSLIGSEKLNSWFLCSEAFLVKIAARGLPLVKTRPFTHIVNTSNICRYLGYVRR